MATVNWLIFLPLFWLLLVMYSAWLVRSDGILNALDQMQNVMADAESKTVKSSFL